MFDSLSPSKVSAMCPSKQYFLLAITTISLVSFGCSTSKQYLSQNNSYPVRTSQPERSPDTVSTRKTCDEPEVQTVAFLDDETDEALSDLIGPRAPLIPPAEVEEFTQSDFGLTIEAIEELALNNNPAIQQAVAASAQADGIRTQVGLKPNPTIGYFGEEIGNEGSGGLHGAFVSQTFVRGDKLAWNRQVIGHDVNAMNWQIATQRQRKYQKEIRLLELMGRFRLGAAIEIKKKLLQRTYPSSQPEESMFPDFVDATVKIDPAG